MQRQLVKSIITGVFLLLLLVLTSVIYISPGRNDPTRDAAAEYDDLLLSASGENVSDDTLLEADAGFVSGLEDAYIELIVPDVLPINETLFCNAFIRDADPGFEGMFIWYVDGEPVLEKRIVPDVGIPGISIDFKYTRTLQESVEVKASLKSFAKVGDVEEITADAIILLENHSKSFWMEQEAERVLGLVTDRYEGDRTLEWAIDNDYTDFDKEVFVNMKGYESKTEYLLWVNLTYQRVNVFKGSAGEWELIKCFIVGTGAPGSGTKRGVTYISRRQPDGWHFGGYIVKPAVRFWPGTGYAFHSRKLHPTTGEVTDSRIGFPISAGCVRMYNEDIDYIFDNIPDDTTVVVH